MPSYRLTTAAKNDLVAIADYGDEQLGIAASDAYRDEMEKRFHELAAHPSRYGAVDDIRRGYRRSICGVHAIYYRVETTGVLIVRVLGRQDPKQALRNLVNPG